MRREVQKWQNSPDMSSPLMTPKEGGSELGSALDGHSRSRSVDKIPLLSDGGSTGIDGGARDVAKERKVGDLPA